uniref:Putative extracellular protein CSOL_002 n=1 Tax=Pseudococcomyxa simplex TaxID=464287 RepID=A0A7L9QE95_9CHLO|nr:putative extracellular protein CSOL_002 [Pseudococcomyxa simplex]
MRQHRQAHMCRAPAAAIFLAACVLCAPTLLEAAAPAPQPAKSGAELEKAIEANVEAQDYQEETVPVNAQVIKAEPAALIASGTGDISTTGPCQEELDQWCAAVKPGEGRLAKCITDQLADESKPGYAGTKTGEKCKKALDDFKIERSDNINRDLPLAKACKADAEKLCAGNFEHYSILGCLREQVEELGAACKEEVFKRQAEAANDWRTDKELKEACEADVASNCKDAKSQSGEVQECLAKHRPLLSWDCQEQLFRQEVENAEDLRLSIKLFHACLADKKTFCADVPPGNARAKECLEDNREQPGFSPACKLEVEKMMESRAADFRLDPKLRVLCEEDIQHVCGFERDSMDTVVGYDARVIQCLQDYREEIQSPACSARVQKIMEYASSDIRFDVPLAEACFEDRQEFCANVPPGSARVIRCLQDRRLELSYECKATLFDQEVRMAENIDFQFPMKQACSADIKRYCKDVQHGHAKIIRCLEENMEQPAL